MKQIETERLLEIGIALSKEKNAENLLCTILNAAMDVTGCDGGTLYIVGEDALHFHILSTRSMGIFQAASREAINLPPVPLQRKNVCSYCAMERSLVNIPDVYASDRFDFSGTTRYDSITGYRTKSVLVVPMEDDKGDIIGVLQLINALDDQGEVIHFDEGYNTVVLSLASQAAIRLTNMNYSAEVINLLNSFVRVMSTAIDERTPYNANHTRNMVVYGERFIDRLPAVCPDWDLAGNREQFLMSIWLHDIGKLIIPLEIMDKETRLGDRLRDVSYRFDLARMRNRLAFLEGSVDEAAWAREEDKLKEAQALVRRVNAAGYIGEEVVAQIEALRNDTFESVDGQTVQLLTEEDVTALCVRRGTLTAGERVVMESHVEMTRRMLDGVAFSRDYKNVPGWASAHHELLDGSGYPKKLHGDEIPREVRLLTIIDVFDALTARDRPYKPPMPVDKAVAILEDMAKRGQMDPVILGYFVALRPWEEAFPSETAR